MAKKAIAVIILTVVFFFSLIFTIPIVILSDNFSNYARVDDSRSFYYAPSNSSTTEELNLKIDRSEVEIKYVYPPYDFVVKIDVYFEISGANALGKSYLDYFNILWENGSSPLNFTMEYKSGIDPLEASSLFKNISIVVFLRADVIFDINTEMEDGDIDIRVPFMVPINDVKVNNTYGNTFLDFTNCIISGTITGISSSGDLELNIDNTKYTQNNNWTLTTKSGDIIIFITHKNQGDEMGANITSNTKTNSGDIIMIYYDNIPDIGAVFTFYNTTTGDGVYAGFGQEIEHDPLFIRYISDDSPAIFNYNISFFKPDLVRRYSFNLTNTL